MNLFTFSDKFPDEDSCKVYLKSLRVKEGIICKRCAGILHYWKKDKEVFECKQCSLRMSLKNDTVFENSNLPLMIWFKAIHLLSSASEITRQLDYPYYETIWEMLHKIRWAMGKRDEKYKLSEYMEIDEGFFKVVDRTMTKEALEEGQKRGRGSLNHAKVLVLVESTPVDNPDKKYKHKPKRKCGYIKMVVMENLSSDSINKTIEPKVDENSVGMTDKYLGYVKLKDIISHEEINTSGIKEVHTIFPWVHSAIGNAKNLLRGIHHSIGKDYLQSYLNEYCYKYNRRYIKDKFDRLLIACISANK
jgi:DNA-directed RNA polymerase subunit M/transcription elongation factor TFIIS